ncbi:MAG: YggT family protein [Acidimicrobiia bacterium]|nr:YggT family protein [Acidimicrobiia bacterium]
MNEADSGAEPELVTPATIELLLRGAKALVIVVYVVVIITFAMLTLGFFLHLAGASPEATFVDWVYRNTERAMEPFRGMFPVRDIDDRSVFDASLLFAAALYGFIAIGLHAVVEYLSAKARRYHLRVTSAPATQDTEPTPLARTNEQAEPTPDVGPQSEHDVPLN